MQVDRQQILWWNPSLRKRTPVYRTRNRGTTRFGRDWELCVGFHRQAGHIQVRRGRSMSSI